MLCLITLSGPLLTATAPTVAFSACTSPTSVEAPRCKSLPFDAWPSACRAKPYTPSRLSFERLRHASDLLGSTGPSDWACMRPARNCWFLPPRLFIVPANYPRFECSRRARFLSTSLKRSSAIERPGAAPPGTSLSRSRGPIRALLPASAVWLDGAGHCPFGLVLFHDRPGRRHRPSTVIVGESGELTCQI
jgi:hypothetical protein